MGEALTIEVQHGRDGAIVTAAGQIDIATAARLRECLLELAASGRPLIADLDQVGFIDSAGLSAGRRGQARRRLRRQPAGGPRPAEDPPAVPAGRTEPPDTAGSHPGRGLAAVRSGPPLASR